MNLPAKKPMPSEWVIEYEKKRDTLVESKNALAQSVQDILMNVSIGGSYGGDVWGRSGRPGPSMRTLEHVLLCSAWRRVYDQWIVSLATAKDKARIDKMLQDPPSFTIQNIRNEFGDYIKDPRGNILRGLAEVFCDLDPAYRSHSKVKIGVEGLPKRVIISNLSSYGYGREKLNDLINAIRLYQLKAPIEYVELSEWIDKSLKTPTENDGITLKRFKNSNCHVIFDKYTLLDVNRALGEYYGDTLPDAAEQQSEKRKSTAVSKDLQYYPTPVSVVSQLIYDLGVAKNGLILEPSCGCGRIMDALVKDGYKTWGVEYDPTRAAEARAKGHKVTIGNFLDQPSTAMFDGVVMNPPFYGMHYLQHIETALKWLKPSGRLVSILPVTARYDHDKITKEWAEKNDVNWKHLRWSSLPVGSFSESGTNINTVILRLWKN